MPLKKGSCLNEEYTEMLKQLQRQLMECCKLYDKLPECIAGRIDQIAIVDNHRLSRCLATGLVQINAALLDFGIEEDDNGR